MKKLFNLAKILLIVTQVILLSACGAKKVEYKNPTESKDSLRKLSASPTKKQSVSEMRVQMLRDTALSVGARGGLAHRAKEINEVTDNYSSFLDKVYNFYGMLLNDNVMPPILIEGRNNLNLTSDDSIRVADRNYRIIKQARFVTAVPTWRDYLILHYAAPEQPDRSLLPRSKPERIVWEKYIEEGWQAGIEQADVIFQENIFKLTRDYNGMILYRTLLAKNMVTPPYVASMNLGVTGDDSNLNINDKILRITAKPGLNMSSKEWKATVSKND